MLGGLGWGFYSGLQGNSFTSGSYFMDRMIWDNSSQSARLLIHFGVRPRPRLASRL